VDVPILVGASLLVYLLAGDGVLSMSDGTLLAVSGIAYVVFLVRASRKTKPAVEAEYAQEFGTKSGGGARGILVNVGLVLGGLGMLVLGSRWLVASASEFARALGVSELVIALTVVATGTSLPELATSVLAALRGERDIAVGNVIGSNLFNLLFVLGLAGLVAPQGIAVSPAMLRFDLPVMLAASVACLPIFLTGYTISRWEGGVLLGYYVAFTSFVILRATEHDALPAFSGVMIAFVIPLTVISFAIITWRHFHRGRPAD
jgi:cation:H+ antiporter